METLRNAPGFLGMGANLLVDVTLVVEILFFITICLGVAAQLKKSYRWHDRLQIPVVVLNLFFIALVMIPSFVTALGQLPAGLIQTSVLVPAVHGFLGVLAEGLAIYCLLAGLRILPRQIGALRYWMWATFAAWTVTILFGLGLYLVWYTSDSAAGPAVEAVSEHDADLVQDLPEPSPTEASEVVVEQTKEPVAPEPSRTPTTPPTEVVEQPPTATPAPVSVGLLSISDGQVHSDQVTLQLAGVAPLDSASVYEGWLQGEGVPPLSLGILPVAGDAIDYTFVDPLSRRLLDSYNGVFITIEPANDADPNPSETVMYTGEVAPAVMPHVRNLVTTFAASPDGDGLALNALAEAVRTVELAEIQQQYVTQNDLVNLLAHAEATINVLEGMNGPNYGDSDGDGAISDPSDHFGMLGFGDNLGYLQNAAAQAGQARQATGATELVALHAGHVETAAANALAWAEQLRDLELQVVQTNNPAEVASQVAQLVELARALVDGVDANGNGQIEPIPGEGGVRTMYEHSQLMASIEIFATADQVAPAAEPTGEPTTEPSPTPTPEPTATPVPPPTPTPLPPTPTIELISEHDEVISEHDGE